MHKIFLELPTNFARSFMGRKALLHVVAIIATYLIVIAGIDWWYFVSLQKTAVMKVLFPAVIIGGLLPILLPLIFYGVGMFKKREEWKVAALALGQAAILGSLISSLYKALTGRIQPDMTNLILDISHQFQFGIWEHGIFWGWPSSHTTIAFAMAATAFILYGKRKSIRWGALIYAFYIGVGVTSGIHWFSEFIAGALVGTAIGIAVGESFLERIRKSAPISG